MLVLLAQAISVRLTECIHKLIRLQLTERLAVESLVIMALSILAGSQSEGDAAARAFIQASCPMFEAFWQGRLIPGARIDSLPFVEVRL